MVRAKATSHVGAGGGCRIARSRGLILDASGQSAWLGSDLSRQEPTKSQVQILPAPPLPLFSRGAHPVEATNK